MSKKHKFVMAEVKEEYTDGSIEWEGPYLYRNDDYFRQGVMKGECRIVDTPYTTTQLAQLLDQELEGDNRHGLVGINEWLVKTLTKIASDDVARQLIERLENTNFFYR